MSSISLALSGIDAAQRQLAGTAERLATAGLPNGSSGDSVDLSAEIVSMLAARNAVALQVAVAHTVQDTEKSLFSLLA